MKINGAFTGLGFSPQFSVSEQIPFNISIWGSFSASVQMERSLDGGSTFLPLTAAGQNLYSWNAPASEIAEEPEGGAIYRLNCTAYISGTVNYQISQSGVRFG